VTIEVLKGIRSELSALRSDVNARIGETNARIGSTNERIERLERRQTEGEVRLATEIVEVAKAIGRVHELLQSNLSVRGTVEDHERRIITLEARLGQ
jgi:hypothetical protein